jgi:hypothetical protein
VNKLEPLLKFCNFAAELISTKVMSYVTFAEASVKFLNEYVFVNLIISAPFYLFYFFYRTIF